MCPPHDSESPFLAEASGCLHWLVWSHASENVQKSKCELSEAIEEYVELSNREGSDCELSNYAKQHAALVQVQITAGKAE